MSGIAALLLMYLNEEVSLVCILDVQAVRQSTSVCMQALLLMIVRNFVVELFIDLAVISLCGVCSVRLRNTPLSHIPVYTFYK